MGFDERGVVRGLFGIDGVVWCVGLWRRSCALMHGPLMQVVGCVTFGAASVHELLAQATTALT